MLIGVGFFLVGEWAGAATVVGFCSPWPANDRSHRSTAGGSAMLFELNTWVLTVVLVVIVGGFVAAGVLAGPRDPSPDRVAP